MKHLVNSCQYDLVVKKLAQVNKIHAYNKYMLFNNGITETTEFTCVFIVLGILAGTHDTSFIGR
jgi:hypothetical protein